MTNNNKIKFPMSNSKLKKLAILSSGLEKRRDRGYEQSSYKLFDNIRNDKEFGCLVELYKGSGQNNNHDEFVIKSFANKRWVKKLGDKVFSDSYVFEYIIFAVFFIIHCLLRNKRFDVIYTQEPRVAKTLYQLKPLLKGRPRIVFAMGVKMTPEHYVNISDRVQIVNIEHYKNATKMYPTSNKFILLENPNSILSVYNGADNRNSLRAKYNIKTQNVLLSIGAINSTIKRMNYVISEFKNVNQNWTLVLVGNPQEEELLHEATNSLGERFRHFFVEPKDIPELFALADIFALASIVEGFPNVLLESISNQVPSIMHKRELHEWALENSNFLVDMTIPGALSSFINSLTEDRWNSEKQHLKALYETRYSWDVQRYKYQQLLLEN